MTHVEFTDTFVWIPKHTSKEQITLLSRVERAYTSSAPQRTSLNEHHRIYIRKSRLKRDSMKDTHCTIPKVSNHFDIDCNCATTPLQHSEADVADNTDRGASKIFTQLNTNIKINTWYALAAGTRHVGLGVGNLWYSMKVFISETTLDKRSM